MNSNSMMFLLVVIVSGLLIVELVYYGGVLVLRFLEMRDPTQVPGDGQTTAVYSDSSLGASAPNQINAAYQQPAVLRVLPSQEGGIPYASRTT